MATLSNSKGISSRSVIEVPAQWDPQWFRTFIRTQLSTADVRNAVPGAGIVISGNPTTNATISTNSAVQALFAQPYVLLGTPVAPAVLTGYRGLAIESSVLTLTDGGATHAITVGVASHGIGNAKIRQSGPLSVIGNALNGISDVADIAASADGQLLRRAGTALGFGTVKLADTAGLGASFTTSGLTAGQVLRANGATGAAFTALAFTDLPTMPTLTVLGNATGGSATPTALSQTQLTVLVNTFSTSLSGAVPASGGGTANYLRADGTWTAPGANPTALIGLTAANGTAATFMRSDGAPALDQGITPTWLGSHKFNSTVGINGAVPPAQVAGFGTPTGTGVIANFPGATATLPQCSQAIAQLIKDLKAFGLYGT